MQFDYQEGNDQLGFTLSILLLLAKSDQCTKMTDANVIVLANSLQLRPFTDDVIESLTYMLSKNCERLLCNRYLIGKIIDFILSNVSKRSKAVGLLLKFCEVSDSEINAANREMINQDPNVTQLKTDLLSSEDEYEILMTLELLKLLIGQERSSKDLKMASLKNIGDLLEKIDTGTPSKANTRFSIQADRRATIATPDLELSNIKIDRSIWEQKSVLKLISSYFSDEDRSNFILVCKLFYSLLIFEEVAVERRKILHLQVNLILLHLTTTTNQRVVDLCTDVVKELCLIDSTVIELIASHYFEMVVGKIEKSETRRFDATPETLNQIVSLLNTLCKEHMNLCTKADTILGRVLLHHIPENEIIIDRPPPYSLFNTLLLMATLNNGCIPTIQFIEYLSLADIKKFLPFLATYDGEFDKELAIFLTKRVISSPQLGLQVYWCEKSGIFGPNGKIKTGRVSFTLETTVGFFLRLSGMSKKVGRKFMLDTPTIDPITGKTLRSAEVKAILNSANKPMLLDLYYHDTMMAPRQIIFKKGEDLRADYCVQILFGLFNVIWENSGFITPPYIPTYSVVPISKDMGCYEFPFGCFPTASFNWDLFNDLTDEAKLVMIYSQAACLVGSYVLGIRDRTLDNVFVKDGIYFYHFDNATLWNYGPESLVNPLTPKFKAAIFTEWERFRVIVESAYMALNKNSSFIINLCMTLFDFEEEAKKERIYQWLVKSLMVGKKWKRTDIIATVLNSILQEGTEATGGAGNIAGTFLSGTWTGLGVI